MLFQYTYKITTRFFYWIGKAMSFLVPYPYLRYFSKMKIYFFTGYISRHFQSIGKSYIVPRPGLLKGLKYISIGDGTYVWNITTLTAWDSYLGEKYSPVIKIGNKCSFGEDNHITAINNIVIGNNVLTGKKVLITVNAHGETIYELADLHPLERPLYSKGPVIIEDNVWIGEKASIMPGVHIGRGSIIAANSVVTRDIPSYCLAGGTPAKIIKQLKTI